MGEFRSVLETGGGARGDAEADRVSETIAA
jgi:hypothetical protein